MPLYKTLSLWLITRRILWDIPTELESTWLCLNQSEMKIPVSTTLTQTAATQVHLWGLSSSAPTVYQANNRKFYIYFTFILHSFYIHSTFILHSFYIQFYICFTFILHSILHLFYIHFTYILHSFLHSFWILGSLVDKFDCNGSNAMILLTVIVACHW